MQTLWKISAALHNLLPYLHISTRLIRHLHDELAPLPVGLADQLVQDVEVDRGPQVIDVGHEDVLAALRDQLVQQARIVEAGVNVAVPRRIPGLRLLPVHAQVCGHREEGFFVDARVPVHKTSSAFQASSLIVRIQAASGDI